MRFLVIFLCVFFPALVLGQDVEPIADLAAKASDPSFLAQVISAVLVGDGVSDGARWGAGILLLQFSLFGVWQRTKAEVLCRVGKWADIVSRAVPAALVAGALVGAALYAGKDVAEAVDMAIQPTLGVLGIHGIWKALPWGRAADTMARVAALSEDDHASD